MHLSLYLSSHLHTDLQMDNAHGFAVFSGAARRRLGVGEDAVVLQGEPPRSPTLAEVSPLVEDPGHAGGAGAGADVRSSGIGLRSAAGEIHRRASPQERRLWRPLPDPGALQRYAAQRVHLLHPHRGK